VRGTKWHHPGPIYHYSHRYCMIALGNSFSHLACQSQFQNSFPASKNVFWVLNSDYGDICYIDCAVYLTEIGYDVSGKSLWM
jgi:hypothetical protein